MDPLIAVMNIIDQGFDPRTGEIDEVMDQIMKEQVEAYGGTIPEPPQRISENNRRLLLTRK